MCPDWLVCCSMQGWICNANTKHRTLPELAMTGICDFILHGPIVQLLLCRPVCNSYDEAILFTSSQEALAWVLQKYPPEVRQAFLCWKCSKEPGVPCDGKVQSHEDILSLSGC